MNAQAILRSLQEGVISQEEAKRRLRETLSGESGPTPEQHQSSERESYEAAKRQAAPESDAIAIIGMSGQFPMADTLEQFWNNLKEGRDCISEVPADRWDMSFYDADPKSPGKSYSKWMGVLENADRFDPHFFQLSPAEAELMDPQQRLFLEHCWRSLEDAGIAPSSLAGSRCGVFAGCSVNDYDHHMGSEGLSAYGLVGRSIAILPARISYLLNLKGPCLAIDTSCSASLVAIAEACNSLKLGDSDLALAGGVCVLTTPDMHIMTSKAGMLSPDGRCYTFDNRANGFVPGEGAGVILLKRLADAVRDEDLIYGVIRGWGVNQDGRTNGITAPSSQSQSELERDVYTRFGINPDSITMVEAHGTGTKLGDPIEVEALIASMRTFTRKQGYCALGSVKSNIGHLLTAAGAASVIKVLLSMKHKMLPPTIHFQSLNDHISLDASPFYVNASLKAWEPGASGTRRAAVSSFGFSGTNAHLVLEEYPYANRNSAEEGGANGGQSFPSGGETLIFPLSAPDADSLKRYAKQLRDWAVSSAASNDSTMLKPLAYTMQTGREAMKVRMAVMASHVTDLIQGLDHFLNDHPSPVVLSSPQTAGGREQHDMYRLQGGPASGGQEYAANLSRQWVSGGEVVWRDLYTVRPMRLRLPGYPFKRERFWIHRAAIQAAPALEAIVPPASPLSDAKAYVYELLGRHSLGIQPGQSADELNELRPLIYLGLDSLVGIHIQNTIMKDYGIEVTMAQLMDGLHTKGLIELLQRSGPVNSQSIGEVKNRGLDEGQQWQEVATQSEQKQEKAVWMEL